MTQQQQQWHTAWLGDDIVVYRDGQPIERLQGADIRRVIFVTRNGGRRDGEVAHVFVDLGDEAVLLAPETGIAGRVHFERQSFWAPRNCVYWIDERDARLPVGWRFARVLREATARPACRRLSAQALAQALRGAHIAGPMSWQQREWERMAQRRPLATPVRTSGREGLAHDAAGFAGRA